MRTIKELEKEIEEHIEKYGCERNCNATSMCIIEEKLETLKEVLELINELEYDSNERSVVDYHELKQRIAEGERKNG